jgi:hypothetical protein
MIASNIPITHPNRTSVPQVQITMLIIDNIAQIAWNLKISFELKFKLIKPQNACCKNQDHKQRKQDGLL